MPSISKSLFIATINDLRVQHAYDKYTQGLMVEVFKLNKIESELNSKYINSILNLLRIHFPKDSDGHCEIAQYCFVINFGKNGDDYETPGELYERLILRI